jgi:hypothetical protein
MLRSDTPLAKQSPEFGMTIDELSPFAAAARALIPN